MSEPKGGSSEPRQAVERAADAAMEGAENYLVNRGAKLDKVVVWVWASDVPENEQDAAVAGQGFKDSAELLSDMMGHLKGTAEQLGIKMDFIPHEKPPGQG